MVLINENQRRQEDAVYNSRLIKNYIDYVKEFYPIVKIDTILKRAHLSPHEIEDQGHWFNQQQIDAFHENLAIETGNPEISREVGRYAASSQTSNALKRYALGFITPASAYKMLEKLTSKLSKATVFEVEEISRHKLNVKVSVVPGVKEKPYQCENRLGLLEAVSRLFTNKYAIIEHPICMHKGGVRCEYIIKLEKTPFLIWKLFRNFLILISILLCALLPIFFSSTVFFMAILIAISAISITSYLAERLEKKELNKTVKTQGDAAKDLLDEMNIRYNNALLVQEIGHASSQILVVEELIKVTIEIIEKRLDFDRGMILLANKEKTRLMYSAGFGYNEKQEELLMQNEFHLDQPESRGVFVLAFREKEPYLLSDISEIKQNSSKRSFELAEKMGVQSIICVPIVYENESMGILAVDNVKSGRPLTQSDMNLLRGVASQTALSIANTRYFEERKQLEAQLQVAQKMEAIGTLAGGIAHDFNNILQTIFGYTQIMLMGKQPQDPDYNNLVAMENAAQRASDLTKRLLIFGRKVESNLRPLDLNQEVEQVYRMLERTLPKMINVELHLAPKLKVVNADPVQIEQVMLNLGVNARDAMPEGGKLTFETENVTLSEEFCRTNLGASPGNYALLTISDTGYGMDGDLLEHIYEPFFTTKEAGKGTGLGLAMVYGIVKNHSGYITCNSKTGQGTTFRVYLPETKDASEEPEKKEEKFPLVGGSGTILFVDDEETIRQIGQEMLTRFGFNVIIAEDGEKALEIYRDRQDEIDLVILDLIMPGMGGNRCIKELFRFDPKVKVVITSGYAIDGATREAIEYGAKGFLAKPYNAPEMLHIVREAIESD